MEMLLLLILLHSSHSLHLTATSLQEYTKARCNDGSPALYYSAGQGGGDVMLYLEGGGSCNSSLSCMERCGEEGSSQCSSTDRSPGLDLQEHIWSDDAALNPGFADFTKVFLPHCSSDEHAGQREASIATAGLQFSGRYIVDAVVEDLLDTGLLGAREGQRLVLVGSGSGCAGVMKNCDHVADRLKGEGVKVMCIADSADFSPYWLARQCDQLEVQYSQRQFWKQSGEDSCVAALGEEARQCSSFSTFWEYVETPFMIISSQLDPQVHLCADNPVDTPEIRGEWRRGMVELGFQVLEPRSDVGMFMANCPFSGGILNNQIWDSLEVSLVALPEQRVSLRSAVSAWLSSDPARSRAVDRPETPNQQNCPPLDGAVTK